MITDDMTLREIVTVLSAAGMKIVSIASEGREYVAKLRVEDAHLPEDSTVPPAWATRHAEGRGATIADAVEDARQGWIGYMHFVKEREGRRHAAG